MTRAKQAITCFAVAAGLTVCLMMAGGCQTPVRRISGETHAHSRLLGFDTFRPINQLEDLLLQRMHRNGLVASFTRTSPFSFSNDTGRFHECVYGKMGYLDNQAYTYDLALAAIGLLLLDRQDEAEQILTALERDFYLPKNGKRGLYNAYVVTSQIPVSDLEMGGDGDRMHAGPMLWVALAAINHMKLAGNTRYLEFTLDMVDWCRSDLTYYRFEDDERGGVSMGFGWGPEWSGIFSTEHNVDYFAVLKMLYDAYREAPSDVRAIYKEKGVTPEWMVDEMAHLRRWFSEIVFSRDQHVFLAGVNQYGVDTLRILDGTSWGLGGIGPEEFVSWGIDLDRLINQTESFFRCTYELPDGRTIWGFDFTDPEGYDHQRDPLVWFEGTGQMIIAFEVLSDYFVTKGDPVRAELYKQKAAYYTRNMYDFAEYFDLRGLPYMAIRPKEKTIVKTLKWEWEIPRGRTEQVWVESMSSSMWYLYCLADFYNPMRWSPPGEDGV